MCTVALLWCIVRLRWCTVRLRWWTVRLVAGTLKYSVACLVERGNVCFLGNLVKAETSSDGICQIIAAHTVKKVLWTKVLKL